MNSYVTLGLVFLLGLLLFYYTFLRHVIAFRKAGILFKMPMPLLGNMWGIILKQQSRAEMVYETYNIHPTAKYVGFMDILTPVIAIRDIDLIKQVSVKHFDHFVNHRSFVNEEEDDIFATNLFTLRDDRWREMRNTLSPAFSSSKMKQMFKLMSNCAITFAEHLVNLPAEKKSLDTKDAFTRYTNDVIATCAFGISIDSMKHPNNEFYEMGKKGVIFDSYTSMKIFLIRSMPKLTTMLGMFVFDKKVTKFFTELIRETIRTRDEKGIRRPDMIQLMMDTRGKLGEGKELTLTNMTSQAFVFFFGGFDTTSTLMCFVAYELAINPDIQRKVREEIDAAMEECKGELTYDKIMEMEYLEAVILESHRKWPVATSTERVCTKRFELPPALPGGKPYVLEKGSSILLPSHGFLRDPQYFEEPDKFMPERFLDKEKKLANHPAYFPFGVGPRMCIGHRFALLEVKAMLFYLLYRCELTPSAKTQIPLRLKRSSFTVQSENGFWIQIQPRKDKTNIPVSNGVSH